MSLLDRPQQVNLQDVYPPGNPFLIVQAWVEGVVPTQYGNRNMAKIVAEPLDGGEGQEFAVWGSLCQQVQQLEEGELPQAVTIAKDGNRWLFTPWTGAGAQAPLAGAGGPQEAPGTQPPPATQRAVPEAHVAPDAAADPPNPAPEGGGVQTPPPDEAPF